MKNLYESLLFTTLISVSTVSLADGKSPDLLAALPQGSVQVMSQDEVKNIRGEYYICSYYSGCGYQTVSWFNGIDTIYANGTRWTLTRVNRNWRGTPVSYQSR